MQSLNQSQKARLFYLYVFTWLVDFIWLIYWGAIWSSDAYQSGSESGSSTFVMALSIVAFIVKVMIKITQLAVIIILFMV